jgi:uncharacterized protein YukE
VTAKPPDFEPLASSNPVPGNTDEIAALGKRYTDTAAEIAREAGNLRKLATQAPDGWKGQSGTVFASHATDLAARISQAQGRYATAGSALTACANPMYEAQQRVYAAVWDAKDAQQQLAANAPGPKRPAGSPPLTPAQQKAEGARQTAYGAASDSLSQARTKFNNAVDDYHTAASGAARQIRNELGHDGLKDSWWDQNFGWISKVFMYIAIAVIILAIVALIIACPFTAGLLLALGISAETLATIGTVVGWVLFGLTLGQAVFDGIAAKTGKESWTAFILDVVALATFGFGRFAEVAVKGLTGAAEGVAKGLAASRAAQDAMRARNLPGLLFSLSKFPPAEWGMRLLGMGNALDAASQAAKGAVTALEDAVKAAKPGNLTTLMTFGGGIPAEIAKLSVIGEEVPGSLRIGVATTLAQGLAGVDGVAQWGSFLGSGVFTLNGILTSGG